MEYADYPRDMEPPGGITYAQTKTDSIACVFTSIYGLKPISKDHCNTWFVMSVHGYKALRLRGAGGDDFSRDNKYNEIPYLTNTRFMWNGLPSIDHLENVVYPLQNGLGTVIQGGSSLLDTVLRKDVGGTLGPPATTADQTKDHKDRIAKTFCCILNYIDSRSEFYKHSMRFLSGDGITVFALLRTYALKLPPRIVRAREDSWARMSMDALRLPYSIDGLFKWVDIVKLQARKLGYNGIKQKEKFIEGLPTFFNAEKAQMVHDKGHVFPGTFGAVPGQITAANAANAHEFAGQPDIFAIARAYLDDWTNKIAHVHRHAPSGMVRSLDIYHADYECLNLLASKVTKDTKCFICDGNGHAASQVLDDGTVVQCPNKVLHGKNIRKSDNSEVANEHAKQLDLMNTKVQELYSSIEVLQEELANKVTVGSQHRSYKPRYNNTRNSGRQQLANAAESSDDQTDADTTQEEDECEDQQNSDDSAHSFVTQEAFANSFQRNGNKNKQIFRKQKLRH